MLNKTALETQLKSFFATNDRSPDDAASALAGIIDGYIRTATVTTTVTGVATPAGVVTGAGTGGLT